MLFKTKSDIQTIPPIDLTVPTHLETATFALG